MLSLLTTLVCVLHLSMTCVGWLVMFYVPSTAMSFREGTPIYCPLRRTRSSVFTPSPSGNELQNVTWQSITLPLRYARSTITYVRPNRYILIVHEYSIMTLDSNQIEPNN